MTLPINLVRFRNLADHLRASYWFVPMIMSGVAFLAALLLVRLDRLFFDQQTIQLGTAIFDTVSFRSLALFLATTTLALLGVLLSVVLVPLSIAAGQLGPTVMRTFFRNTGTQVVLGLYVGTILFSLTLLAAVPEGTPHPPPLSSGTLLILFVATIGALLYFINEVARSLQANTVITRLAAELQGDIGRELPGAQLQESDYEAQEAERRSLLEGGRVVRSRHEGYIRAIDYEGLLKLAIHHDTHIALRFESGDFVMRGDPLVYLPATCPQDEALAEQMRRQFLLGSTRTLTQDIDFGLMALVSVAVRALSPAINDPFTAILCLQRLGAALAMIAERSENTRHYHDSAGNVRLLGEPDYFEEHADIAFHQIRQYGRGSTEVLIAILRTITTVGERTRTEQQRRTLRLHADLTDRAAQFGGLMEYDITRVRVQYDATIVALDRLTKETTLKAGS